MTRTFRRHGEAIRATFRDVEVELLRSARDQLRAALDSGDPDDPVLRRLFPAPVLGDESVAAEVRDLLADQLHAQRVAQLDELLAILDRGQRSRGVLRVDLVDDEPLLVLGVLNDLRLAIGASIDVEALDRATIDEDHPHAYPLAVMDYLGMWQEQLLAIIDPESVRHATEGWDDVLDELGDDELAEDDPDDSDGGSG
ncbi:MAG: DUF2017 family protein [Nitriliruptoraceae bacterium]